MSLTTVSKILQDAGRMAIGPYEPGKQGSFPLSFRTGWTKTLLKSLGTCPVEKLRFMSFATGQAKIAMPNFQTAVRIFHTSYHVFLSPFIIFATKPSVAYVKGDFSFIGFFVDILSRGVSRGAQIQRLYHSQAWIFCLWKTYSVYLQCPEGCSSWPLHKMG